MAGRPPKVPPQPTTSPWYADRWVAPRWTPAPGASPDHGIGAHHPIATAPWNLVSFFLGHEASPFGTGVPTIAYRAAKESDQIIRSPLRHNDAQRKAYLSDLRSLLAFAHAKRFEARLVGATPESSSDDMLSLIYSETAQDEIVTLHAAFSDRVVQWVFPHYIGPRQPPWECDVHLGWLYHGTMQRMVLQSAVVSPNFTGVNRYRIALDDAALRTAGLDVRTARQFLEWCAATVTAQFGNDFGLCVTSSDDGRRQCATARLHAHDTPVAAFTYAHHSAALCLELHRPESHTGAFALAPALSTLWYAAMPTPGTRSWIPNNQLLNP